MDQENKNSFSEKDKIAFIDSILNNPDPSCLNLDEYRTRLVSESKGNIKLDRFHNSALKEVKYISWDKENLMFGCSMQMLKKENSEWKPFVRIDDKHGFRHSHVNKSKVTDHMPGNSICEIECPILSLIINSLPDEKARSWKIKLFDNWREESNRFEAYFDNLVKNLKLNKK